MTPERFADELEGMIERTRHILRKKGIEYSDDADRFNQFHRVAAAHEIEPTEALLNMAAKHYISIADMVVDPTKHTLDVWQEKIGDLRNYLFLLEGLVTELIEEENEVWEVQQA